MIYANVCHKSCEIRPSNCCQLARQRPSRAANSLNISKYYRSLFIDYWEGLKFFKASPFHQGDLDLVAGFEAPFQMVRLLSILVACAVAQLYIFLQFSILAHKDQIVIFINIHEKIGVSLKLYDRQRQAFVVKLIPDLPSLDIGTSYFELFIKILLLLGIHRKLYGFPRRSSACKVCGLCKQSHQSLSRIGACNLPHRFEPSYFCCHKKSSLPLKEDIYI